MKKYIVICIGVVVVLALMWNMPYPSQTVPTPEQNELPEVRDYYSSATRGFSVSYPQGYTRDEAYVYELLGLGKEIPGVRLTIPAERAVGTNLSQDTYVSVEQLQSEDVQTCSADMFVQSGGREADKGAEEKVEYGTPYSFIQTVGAGAGNRYEEIVYAIPNSRPCTAVRYFIHYGAIENYPEGMVREFDRGSLVAEFDEIRRSLAFNR